jgi:glycosyltransferase involved in cell wall biosynthesis
MALLDFIRYQDSRRPERPKLTIVVCSYNQAAYIPEAIGAAEKVRDSIDAELLFIDDGSSDDSYQEAVSVLAHLDNCLVATKANRGLVHSLNAGLQLARGELIVFIAADDRLLWQGVEEACRRMEVNVDMWAFFGNGLYFGDAITPYPVYGRHHSRYFDSMPEERGAVVPSRLPAPLLLQATVFRTVFLRSIGGWHIDVTLDDLPLFLRIFAERPVAGIEFLYDLGLMLCEYRLHRGNTSRRVLYQFKNYEQCILRYCEAWALHGEVAEALGTYMLYGIRQGNLEAVLELLRTSCDYRILWLTLGAIVKKALRKAKRCLAS